MSFNPDPSKQAVEVYFSRRTVSLTSPPLIFGNSSVSNCDYHKHLGLLLDNKLVFDRHLREHISKANKGVGLLKRLRKFLPRDSLLTTIMEINYWTNGKICAKVVFPRYTESVKFRSQSRERASKRKPYRGLGTR